MWGLAKGTPVFIIDKVTERGQRQALRNSTQPLLYGVEQRLNKTDNVTATTRVFQAKLYIPGIDSTKQWIPEGSVATLLEDVTDAQYIWKNRTYTRVLIKKGTQVTVGRRWSSAGSSQSRPVTKAKTDYDIACGLDHPWVHYKKVPDRIHETKLSATPVA